MSKYTTSFGFSLAFASVVNGLLVVAKEKIPGVMSGLQKLTGHHWISHSLVILAVFAGLGWLFSRANGGEGIKATPSRFIGITVSGVVAGSVIILGFYLIGD